MNTGLDQYMDIFKDAVEDSVAKITKSFKKILIEVIILFMVIIVYCLEFKVNSLLLISRELADLKYTYWHSPINGLC